jgi:hypothetical protein
MTKSEIRRETIDNIRGLVDTRVTDIGIAMDDFDGGQLAALENVLKDLDVYNMIVDHHEKQ